ncbi:hypothetical protein D3C72_1510660 [compost metagenome]
MQVFTRRALENVTIERVLHVIHVRVDRCRELVTACVLGLLDIEADIAVGQPVKFALDRQAGIGIYREIRDLGRTWQRNDAVQLTILVDAIGHPLNRLSLAQGKHLSRRIIPDRLLVQRRRPGVTLNNPIVTLE